MSKIVIIGAGRVGITAAYTIILSNIVDELVLIDIDEKKLRGEELDLKPCAYFDRPIKITCTTDYSHAKDADLVVITAGIPRAPGESRLDLTKKNIKILQDITLKILQNAPDAVYLIVSNPVDILTYEFLKYSKLPRNRVFGSGTAIDTARLSAVIAEEYKIHPQHVEAYMLGEHGEGSFVLWSSAKIKGKPIENFINREQSSRLDEFLEQVRKMGAEIIEKKAATYYSIGIIVAEIAHAVLSNTSRVMPVSILLENYESVNDVCLSVPAVINSNGAQQIPVSLNSEEKKAFQRSAEEIKKIIDNL